MYYTVAGCTVLIQAYDEWSSHAVFQVFAGWFLNPVSESASTNPNLTLRVRCGVTPPKVPPDFSRFSIIHGGTCFTDNQSYYLKFEDSLIVLGPGNSAEVDLWVDQPYEVSSGKVAQLISHAISPALRRCGVFEIHSAAVIPPHSSKALLLAGPSGCGKSTLTSQLAACGWGYLSDDILLLRESGAELRVEAFRRFFALTAETIAAVKLPGVDFSATSWKERVTPQDHFKTPPIQQATPGIVLFPSITSEGRSRIVPLNGQEAMMRLLRLCPWASYDKPTSSSHLRILGRLANLTSAFDLLTGTDILHAPRQTAEMIQNATAAVSRH